MTKRNPLFPPQARRRKLRHKGTDPTTRFTVNGPITLTLRRWHGSKGSERPGEAALGLATGQPSVGFRRMACRLSLGEDNSFAGESSLMNELGMGPVSKEKLRQVVEAEGQRVEQAQHEQGFALNWQASDCLDNKGEASLGCVGVDGVMTHQITDAEKLKRRRRTAGKRGARARAGRVLKPLPPRKKGADGAWKEVKIVGVYGAHHRHRHWAATARCHLKAAALMGQVARRVHLSGARARVAVVDGAAWIEGRLRECLPDLNAIILDFYHLSEHVSEAMRGVFGEGTTQAQQWADKLMDTIRDEGYAAFEALLQTCQSEHGQTSQSGQALSKLHHYVSERQDMVDYPTFQASGWPIGSGPTESMATVLTTRIKGPGRRWDGEHVGQIMALQALRVNDEWDAYWQSHTPAPPQRRAA